MYSQNEEERYILEAVGKTVGNFLDIGAYDGQTFSNTLALIERGWTGVMLEPGLQAFQALLKRHGDNHRIGLIHAAVGYNSRLVPFWDAAEPYGTTKESNRVKWGGHAHFSPKYLTPLITLEELFQAFSQDIDVLSIDTEGTSVDLFLQFPLALSQTTTLWCQRRKRRWIMPAVICVEHDGRAAECLEHARRYGYREVYRSAENLVFVR